MDGETWSWSRVECLEQNPCHLRSILGQLSRFPYDPTHLRGHAAVAVFSFNPPLKLHPLDNAIDSKLTSSTIVDHNGLSTSQYVYIRNPNKVTYLLTSLDLPCTCITCAFTSGGPGMQSPGDRAGA